MKIALVIERFQLHAGGNERSTQQIAARLIERGHDVTVLTSRCDDPAGALPQGRVRVSGGPGTRSVIGLLAFRRWALRQIETGGYDVSVSMTTAVPADVLQPRSGTVRQTLVRNIDMAGGYPARMVKTATIALSPKRVALLVAEWRTINDARVKKIVAISRYVADQLFHHYTVPSRRIELIPNAAEVARPGDAERQAIRRRVREAMGLDAGDTVLLLAAMNPALKGLPSMLGAMKRVLAERSGVRLIVAGTLDAQWPRRAAELGVAEAVRWTGPTGEMDALYAAADVTVLPTWYDPASKVVLESLLHGVPAISTLHNGASQWVFSPDESRVIPSPFEYRAAGGPAVLGDGRSAGRVIDTAADVEGLAAAVLELCDPEARQRCAANTAGLDRRLSMERHVQDLERLLTEVAGGRGQKSEVRSQKSEIRGQ